jgi:AcrR family transcriptional regulator
MTGISQKSEDAGPAAGPAPGGRPSNLRDRHHELTRELVLRAVVEQLAAGNLGDLTVPEVARAAGVSLRTVYRHFATREELIAAASEWIPEHVWGRASSVLPETLEEFAVSPTTTFPPFDEYPNLVRAMALSRAGNAVRSVRRTRRLENLRRALRDVTGNLPPAEVRQAEAVLGYLSNMLAWLTMRDENQTSGEESGRAVSWAFRTLIDDLRRRNETAARQRETDTTTNGKRGDCDGS